jgi:ABC-type sugar transport system substrate-binding protein
MVNRIRIALVLAILVSLVAAGTTAAQDDGAKQPEDVLLGFVMHNFGSSFTVTIKEGAEDAGKDFGITVEVTGPTAFDPPTAISMFENLLAKQPEGIVVVPNPQAPWTPVLNQYAEEAKIIMVANGDAPGTPRQAYYGVDEVEFGRSEARAVLDAGVTEGKVVVGTCNPSVLPLQQRFQGIQEIFADYPGIDLVGPIDSTAEQTTNFAAWENIVTANPDIKAGIGLCTFEGPSFAQLMPTLDFDFVTVTADLIPETLQAIQDGSVTAAVGQHPYLQGYLPIHDMAQYVLYGVPLPSGAVQLPAEVVTADNVEAVLQRENDDAYQRQWYATFLLTHLEAIHNNVVPFTD